MTSGLKKLLPHDQYPSRLARSPDRLESLWRYVLRPPSAEERMRWTKDGKVLYRLP